MTATAQTLSTTAKTASEIYDAANEAGKALITMDADILNGGFDQYLDHQVGREADFGAMADELSELDLESAHKVALRMLLERAEQLRESRPNDHCAEAEAEWEDEWDAWQEACQRPTDDYYDLKIGDALLTAIASRSYPH